MLQIPYFYLTFFVIFHFSLHNMIPLNAAKRPFCFGKFFLPNLTVFLPVRPVILEQCCPATSRFHRNDGTELFSVCFVSNRYFGCFEGLTQWIQNVLAWTIFGLSFSTFFYASRIQTFIARFNMLLLTDCHAWKKPETFCFSSGLS